MFVSNCFCFILNKLEQVVSDEIAAWRCKIGLWIFTELSRYFHLPKPKKQENYNGEIYGLYVMYYVMRYVTKRFILTSRITLGLENSEFNTVKSQVQGRSR
nr:uncharacterized protein LOC111508840 [Leptinotarsa decemlineata]